MPTVKQIVCLAISRKNNDFCFAGKTRKGDWIRPVSARAGEEVSLYECQYEDRRKPTLLDVMNVPLLEPQPSEQQRENWLLDPDCYWEFVKRLDVRQLDSFLDSPTSLWGSGSSSTDQLNNRVREDDESVPDCSLYLVELEDVRIDVVRQERNGRVRQRPRASFSYNRIQYQLWVKDIAYERARCGETIDTCFATISLARGFGGYRYKLVAAIINDY